MTRRSTLGGLCAGLILAICATASAVIAQMPSPGLEEFQAPPDPRWAAITLRDVTAAHAFILANHPGAIPEGEDPAFRAGLAKSYDVAKARAAKSVSYAGYAATLAGFANGLGDKHLWSRPAYLPNLVRWPGLVVAKRGNAWKVVDADPLGAEHALLGASLTACDGVDVETLAAKSLGQFHAIWSIDAQQRQAAPWLLMDEGNPFIHRPERCQFISGGTATEVALTWRLVKREEMIPRIKTAAAAGAAGFGVRKVGDGYWIALESLDKRAEAVVAAVEAQKDSLRSAAFVVLDLRGNGGGNSDYSSSIEKALYGADKVDKAFDAPPSSCPGVTFRASPGDIAGAEFSLQTQGDHMSPEGRRFEEEMVASLHEAQAKGRAFTGPVSCPLMPVMVAHGAPRALADLKASKTYVLTDSACFSSCLIAAMEFRQMGAIHIGQTTDAATHYINVRETFLPSGYSSFTTLQALWPSASTQFGPFAPDIGYEGDIADTAGVEAWVKMIAASRTKA